MTDASTPHPQITRQAVYTAFGERVWTAGGSTATRYGYAGAHGYEEKLLPKPYGSPDFGFMHVGARWYDPSTGRFLERDPIGINGGLNLYLYVDGMPVALVDPDGVVPVWVAKAYLWVTGGDKSWLDNPRKVRRAQKASLAVAAVSGGAAILCTAAGFNPWIGQIARHGAHHTFRWLGTRRHIQIMIRTGRCRTTHFRIPY
jgi:RHS repeat-associated protein